MWRDSATNTTAYSRDSTSKFNFIQGALPSKHLCLVHPIETALQQNQGNKLQDYSDYPQMCTDGKFRSLSLRYIIRLLLGLAMRQFLLMRIDAHQMRIRCASMRIFRITNKKISPCSCGHFEMRLTSVGFTVPKL